MLLERSPKAEEACFQKAETEARGFIGWLLNESLLAMGAMEVASKT